jgi:hypothetical protein
MLGVYTAISYVQILTTMIFAPASHYRRSCELLKTQATT